MFIDKNRLQMNIIENILTTERYNRAYKPQKNS